MSESAENPFFQLDPGVTWMGRVTIQPPPPMWVQFTWGEAVIQFHEDGRLVVEGCPTMDAAAVAFWRAVVRWTPTGVTVTLPEGYGVGA